MCVDDFSILNWFLNQASTDIWVEECPLPRRRRVRLALSSHSTRQLQGQLTVGLHRHTAVPTCYVAQTHCGSSMTSGARSGALHCMVGPVI